MIPAVAGPIARIAAEQPELNFCKPLPVPNVSNLHCEIAFTDPKTSARVVALLSKTTSPVKLMVIAKDLSPKPVNMPDQTNDSGR